MSASTISAAAAATATATEVHAYSKLPKGAKLLGGAEERFEEFTIAKLGRAAKVKAYVKAVIEAGPQGITTKEITALTGIAHPGPYPSFDLRKKGIRVGSIGGRIVLVKRKGYSTKAELQALAEAVGAFQD